jgi:hypothetical protein
VSRRRFLPAAESGDAHAERASGERTRREYADAGAEAEHARLVERGRLAATLESELRQACRAEASARRMLGVIAREMLRRRAYSRLGFVRLGDYAGERLGVSGRALEIAARVATRLDELPAIDAAFREGEITWTQVCLLCKVAGPADEGSWLERARRGTVDDLEALIAVRRAGGVESSGSGLGGGGDADPDPTDALIDGEPAATLRIGCPARVRVLWRRTLELAERVAGARLAAWQAAEIIAAEGIAGRPAGVPIGDRVLLASMRLARRLRRAAAVAHRQGSADASATAPGQSATIAAPPAAAADPVGVVAASAALPSEPSFEATSAIGSPVPLASCDAFVLDARLLAATVRVRSVEPRIGKLLRLLADHRLYRLLGYRSLERYVRARLGLGVRKAWALLKIERAACRAPAFAAAYAAGRLSWLQALTLLPVLNRDTEAAWLGRARAVTLRRLRDEVNWVLERRDVLGSDQPLAPPPLDVDLIAGGQGDGERIVGGAVGSMGEGGVEGERAVSGARSASEPPHSPGLQIGACAPAPGEAARGAGGVAGAAPGLEVRDAEIRFTGPLSVVALFRDALDAYDRPGEPRWAALERLLVGVSADWRAEPRHRDPVFARDGWRCTVPGCSGRRNLHDHHLQFRSRGGGNERANRLTVCAAHHLHGIHTGVVRSWGRAPGAVHWELGVRTGMTPFLVCVGDRVIGGSAQRSGSGPVGAAYDAASRARPAAPSRTRAAIAAAS